MQLLELELLNSDMGIDLDLDLELDMDIWYFLREQQPT